MEKIIQDIKEIEKPKVLYKYRNWNNDNHKRFITENEVYMAPPSSFEDELDCKIPIRYDKLTEKQAFLFALNLSKRINPSFNRQRHRVESRKWAKEKIYLKNYNEYTSFYFQEYDKRLGVLSLTEHKCLDEMWLKYSDNHSGFCIGYNTDVLFNFLGGGGIVHYREEIPVILPEPFMDIEDIRYLQVYYKEKKWDFEKEYRTQKFWINGASQRDRQIRLPKEAFHHVIIGRNISPKDKEELIESVREYIGDIPILEESEICK